MRANEAIPAAFKITMKTPVRYAKVENADVMPNCLWCEYTVLDGILSIHQMGIVNDLDILVCRCQNCGGVCVLVTEIQLSETPVPVTRG